MTYTTETNYTQTVTGNRDFSVGFPFLATTDIKVQLNGTTKTLTNDYTIVQSGANTTVNFNTAPADNDKIRLFRDTDIDTIEATYAAGSSIRASDLNTNNTQLLYAAQEFGTLKSDTSVSFTLGNKGDIAVNSSTDWTLNNNSVELANMADNSVGTNELVNDSVTTAKIASDAVTLDKITDLITSKLVPTGTVIWYAGSSAPTGYLKANGDAIANGNGTTQGVTANFAALHAIVGSNLPDLRGEFVRGWDDSKGTDSGRAIRSTQTELTKSHKHWISSADKDDANMTGTGTNTQQYGLFADSGTYNADDPYKSTGRNTAVTGGTETRPRNVALLACIKY